MDICTHKTLRQTTLADASQPWHAIMSLLGEQQSYLSAYIAVYTR